LSGRLGRQAFHAHVKAGQELLVLLVENTRPSCREPFSLNGITNIIK
jgi:hypothetical protein